MFCSKFCTPTSLFYIYLPENNVLPLLILMLMKFVRLLCGACLLLQKEKSDPKESLRRQMLGRAREGGNAKSCLSLMTLRWQGWLTRQMAEGGRTH